MKCRVNSSICPTLERGNLGQNVNVAFNVRIGDYVKIQNNVSIYEGVELEDYVFLACTRLGEILFIIRFHPRMKWGGGWSDCLRLIERLRAARAGGRAKRVSEPTMGISFNTMS
jgi:hypothetical protein